MKNGKIPCFGVTFRGAGAPRAGARLLSLRLFGPPYSHQGLRGPGATIGPRILLRG